MEKDKWEDGPVGKVLALQAGGPVLKPWYSHKKNQVWWHSFQTGGFLGLASQTALPMQQDPDL